MIPHSDMMIMICHYVVTSYCWHDTL